MTLGRQEVTQLSGIHSRTNHYQLSLLVLHQGGDHVNPSWKDRWPLSGDLAFAISFLLRPGQQSLLLLRLCLWFESVGQQWSGPLAVLN